MMKERLEKLFYSLFRSRTPLTIGGMQKTFRTDNSGLYRRVRRAGGEREQLEYFISQLRPDDVVWDVGAFMGMYSMFAASAVGDGGRVFTFEPEPGAGQLIRENGRINRTENLTLIEAALGNTDGEALIYPPGAGQNAISSLRPDERLEEVGIPIRISSGQTLVENSLAEAPGVVKMDVEGAEYQALDGMRELLGRPGCRFLFLELHPDDLPRFDASETAVRDLLKDVGFHVDREIRRGTETHLFCFK